MQTKQASIWKTRYFFLQVIKHVILQYKQKRGPGPPGSQGMAHSLGGVSAIGDERADQQLVSVSSRNVQRSVPILIFTVDFRP